MTAPQNDAVRVALRPLDAGAMDTLYDWIQNEVAAISGASEVTASAAVGVTTSLNGRQTRGLIKAVVAKEAFTAAGLSESVVIATLPAKARIVSCVLDVTDALVLGTSGLTVEVGVDDGDTPDPNALIVSGAADAAGQLGLLDADMGVGLARASVVQGGIIPNWADTSDVTITLTSDDDDLGDGDVTGLTAGSMTVYLVVELMP